MGSRLATLIALGFVVIATAVGTSAQSSADEQAKARYDNGKRFLSLANYKEALADLDEAATKYASSSWAGEALLLKAEYYVEVARNFNQAKADLEKIKNYPAVEPAAYLIAGRIKLAEDRSRSNLDSAVADFHRAHDYYRSRDYVAEGRFREGEAKRLAGLVDDAIEEFQGLALSDPQSIWTARALVQLASCLTFRNRWPEALSALQRLRADFEGNQDARPELQAAINLNTILYRLYIRRPPEQTAFKYSSAKPLAPSTKFEDVTAMTFLPNDTLVVASKIGLILIDESGEVHPVIRAQEPTAVATRRRGESYVMTFKRDESPVFLAQRSLMLGIGAGTPLKIPEPPDKTKFVEGPSSLVQTWKRDWLVGDVNAKTIWAFTETGEFSKPFYSGANITPHRLAIDVFDNVAVLDTDRKNITLLDREGKRVQTIESTGQGYKLDRPVDIAFDPLGHLYVLDRGKGEIFVFSPQWVPGPRLQAVFTGPAEKDPGSFRKAVALGLDSHGRLFIFDENAKRIQVYQ